jgi:hypothetical protein
MTNTTLEKIRAFSNDRMKNNALEALMDWYGVTSFMKIPESAALEFLKKLENNEIKLGGYFDED